MHHTHFFTLATISLVGTIFTSCGPATQTQDVAKAQLQNVALTSEKEQRDAITEAQKASLTQEWETLKRTSEEQFRNNEISIADAKARLKRIATLEQTNRKLKERIESFQQGQVDWGLFKRAFNYDMQALGNELHILSASKQEVRK